MDKYIEVLKFLEELIKIEESKPKIYLFFNRKKIKWLNELYLEKLKILENIVDENL